MVFRTGELIAAWILAVVIGILHYGEVSGYNALSRGLSVPEQKEAWLKTENAFYFSYYEELVEAPSTSAGLWAAVRDQRSEAPDTINAIHRFNIYQEILSGLLFRAAAWLVGRENLVDPWYFFRGCSYALQGIGHVGLVRLAAAIGGDGVLGGILPGLTVAWLAFLHRLDFSRINDVGMLELRENWAMPFIICQVWALINLLLTHPELASSSKVTSWTFLCWRWAFRTLTVCCILVWQFSSFAFLLQVSAVFLCTLLACSAGARSAMNEVINSHLISISIAAVFLFGNELLVQHLLVTQCIAIKTVLWLRASPPRWRLFFWLDGALAVGLFVFLRVLQMPFATADEHVWELYADKMRTLFPSYLTQIQREPTFNTRLYNAVSVFNFISWQTIRIGLQTKVYELAALALLVQGGAFLRRVLLTRRDSNVDGDGKGKRVVRPEEDNASDTKSYAAAFGFFVLLVQTALFLVLGCFISRLKCIGVPFLLVITATALSPKPIETLIGSFWGDGCSYLVKMLRRVIFILAAMGQVWHLTFLSRKLPFIEGRASLHGDKSWPDGDRGEFYNWMAANVPKNEIIIAAMTLSAELRMATPLRFAIHPQFEAQHLRDRVQELYQFYQCTSPASFAKTMRKYGSRYIVLEFKRCSFGPFLLDRYPEVNCKENERPWKDLFCPRALASPLFEMLWVNAEFAVLRLRPKEEVPKGAKAGSVEDIKTWQPALERCLAEEPSVCASRAADLALSFRKMGQSGVSRVLSQWAEEHGSQDAAYQYIKAFDLDMNLQQSDKARSYYQRAHELEPNNPFFLKEYLMYLEMVAKDNRTLWKLLEPRRHTRGDRLSITDMASPSLACEASITARELFLDHDWSQELWNLAVQEGPGNQCTENNWPLHQDGKKMTDELSAWNLFVNIFWHRKVRSTMLSAVANGGRHDFADRRPRRTWSLRAVFDD